MTDIRFGYLNYELHDCPCLKKVKAKFVRLKVSLHVPNRTRATLDKKCAHFPVTLDHLEAMSSAAL